MKPVVDADLCIGCGMCESVCPEAFRLEEDGLSHPVAETIGEDLYECAREAQDSCPTDAISLQE